MSKETDHNSPTPAPYRVMRYHRDGGQRIMTDKSIDDLLMTDPDWSEAPWPVKLPPVAVTPKSEKERIDELQVRVDQLESKLDALTTALEPSPFVSEPDPEAPKSSARDSLKSKR